MPKFLITGGAGFIGANLAHYLRREVTDSTIFVLDKLTYAGNRSYLEDLEREGVLKFYRADVSDEAAFADFFESSQPDAVFHLAAESHVDRSIDGPRPFLQSNVDGTFSVLEVLRKSSRDVRLVHVSTDEVFGDLGPGESPFTERSQYKPSSPYSASKAASDHFVRAYVRTYGLNAVITNCSNNFGPFQFPEKLVPLFIRNIRDGKPLPVYGDGKNVRDWLFVEDHCAALHLVFKKGTCGATYNVGATNEWSNIDLVHLLCDLVDDALDRPRNSRSLVSHVVDRSGHDRRYAVDASKIREELGWRPVHDFAVNMKRTVRWYLDNFSKYWEDKS